MAGDPCSIPAGRSTGEGIGHILQYSWPTFGSAGKESVCNVGDSGSIPGLGRSPGEGKGCPLLENSMDCIVQTVGCGWATFTYHIIYTSKNKQLHRIFYNKFQASDMYSTSSRKLGTNLLSSTKFPPRENFQRDTILRGSCKGGWMEYSPSVMIFPTSKLIFIQYPYSVFFL